MSPDERLLSRVRGEYSEMPGLRLTVAQACRLWQLDEATCVEVFEALVREFVVYRVPDGTFVAYSGIRPRPVKAALDPDKPVPGTRRAG